MRPGFRGRLFLASVALIAVVGLASVLYLEADLRLRLESRIETDLRRNAQGARVTVETLPGRLGPGADALADRLGRALSARVTVIADDGAVLGDSKLGPTELAVVDNHGDRPEVRAARAHGVGVARRHSHTIGTDLLYVAIPYERPDGQGVVRLATPLAEVDEAVRRLRLSLALAGLLGLDVAFLASGIASHVLSRNLRQIIRSARDLAEGRRRPHIPVPPEEELGGLARTINRMSDELETLVSALAEERDRFEAVLEGMSEAVVALDAGRRVSLANRAAVGLLEMNEPPIGRTLAETVRVPELHRLVEEVRPGVTTEAEFELPGEPARRVLARATRQRGGGAVLVMHDVTRLRHLETLRRDFVANVSHELRTPVSVIRANAETLLDGALEDGPEVARRFLEPLLRNAERLSRLIADLLDISRLEAGQFHLEPEPIAVEAVARRAIEAVEDRARNKEMALRTEIPEGLRVRADERALDQILLNLLENAVKYTPARGHVVIRARPDGPRTRIEVVDDGPGVAPQHRPRLFERFYRVDPGRSRAMGGTGLGLAIVKHLALVQGGRVGMDPARPHGSIFWVELPTAPPAPS